MIVLNEGRLQLSPSHVWTDVAPLRRALTQARFQRDEQLSRKPADDAGASIAAVLEHYAGPFLADEEGPPWLLAGREALTAAVRQALILADKLFEGSADELLIPALEKALLADPTSEDLARSLCERTCVKVTTAKQSESTADYARCSLCCWPLPPLRTRSMFVSKLTRPKHEASFQSPNIHRSRTSWRENAD